MALGARVAAGGMGRVLVRSGTLGALLGLVHCLAELPRRRDQALGLGRDRLRVPGVQAARGVLKRRGDRALLLLGGLVAVFGQRLFGGMDDRVGLVLGLD